METPYEFIHMATVERLADIMGHLYDEDENCNPSTPKTSALRLQRRRHRAEDAAQPPRKIQPRSIQLLNP